MNRQLSYLSITLALTLGLILAVLWLSGAIVQPALAQSGTGIIRVSTTDPNSADVPDCGSQAAPCLTIQWAVDEALPGEEIRVAAGTYDAYNNEGGHDQCVYISKTLTLRGGYTTTSGGWDQPDPDANPTIVDADGQGRGLYISGDITVTVEGLDIINGDATGESSHYGSDRGGGVFVAGATTTLSDCALYDNIGSTTVFGRGGGIFAREATLTVDDCTIHDNLASHAGQGHGGGVYAYDSHSVLTGNKVYGNTGSNSDHGAGGGLISFIGRVYLTGNTIYSNTASHAAIGEGGGIYAMLPISISLVGNEVLSNTGGTSYGYGGGLAVEDGQNAALVDNTFHGNLACTSGKGKGGGIWLLASPSTLTGNMVENNTASLSGNGYGGGLWVWQTVTTLEGNNLLRNTATLSATAEGMGGALYATGKTRMDMTNNMVTQNHANSQGSGLWFSGESSQVVGALLHNTIADNGAPQTRASLIAGTIQAAASQGVYAASNTTLYFTNTILSGHSDAAIFVSDSSTANLVATLWFNNGSHTAGPGTINTGLINFERDPAFADPGDDDYHLTLTSGAIDAGVDAGVYDDFDGEPRPARNGYDLGADELVHDLQFEPDRAATGLPGALVVYSHTLSNTSAITAAFAITHTSSQGWDVAYASPITVAANQSANVQVTVSLPTTALSGTVDTTVITAYAQAVPSVYDTVTDVTTIIVPPSSPPRVYLPMVLKNR